MTDHTEGPDAVAFPDEFAAMLNAYTDGVSSLALAMTRYGVGAGTKEQKQGVTDGYRSLCREYAALVRERDRMRPTSWQEQVREFHRLMGFPAPDRPTTLSTTQFTLRADLMQEELDEFRQADERADFIGMIDALVDLSYVVLGSAVEMGVDLAPFFAEVHQANMGKQAPVGGGKAIKPAGWVAPDIAGVFQSVYAATAPADGGEPT